MIVKISATTGFVEKVKVPAPILVSEGRLVEALGIKVWALPLEKRKIPVPGARLFKVEKSTDPAVSKVEEPKSKPPPVASTRSATTYRPVPRLKVPDAMDKCPVEKSLVKTMVPPDPFWKIVGWTVPFFGVKF